VCKFSKIIGEKIKKINNVLILCESTFGVNTLHNKTFFFIKYKFMRVRWGYIILYNTYTCILYIYIYIFIYFFMNIINSNKMQTSKNVFYGVVKRYLCYAFSVYFYRGVKYNIRNAYRSTYLLSFGEVSVKDRRLRFDGIVVKSF